MSIQENINCLEATILPLIEAYNTTMDEGMKKNFYRAIKREYIDYHTYVRNVPKLVVPNYQKISDFITTNNPFKHHCGEQGYDSTRDKPCPGCEERMK